MEPNQQSEIGKQKNCYFIYFFGSSNHLILCYFLTQYAAGRRKSHFFMLGLHSVQCKLSTSTSENIPFHFKYQRCCKILLSLFLGGEEKSLSAKKKLDLVCESLFVNRGWCTNERRSNVTEACIPLFS